MAVCEKCSEKYSEDLESCPSCKHRQSVRKGCTVLFAAALLFMFGVVYLLKQVPPDSPEKSVPSWCEVFIKQQLNDPNSAEFDQTSLNLPATKNEDGSYSALIELRANNAFGGKVKAQYWCTVKPGDHDGDNWKPINIVQTN